MGRSLLAAVLAALAVAGPAVAQTTQPAPPKCERASCQDPLFTVHYPFDRTFVTSHGVEVQLPVHFYEADLLQLAGTADLHVLREMTAGSGFEPLQTEDGKGVLSLAIVNYVDTNIEPYQEWFIGIPANRERRTVPKDDPYALFGATIDPENVTYGVKLLIDKQLSIDVGREYYGLDKEPEPEVMKVAITDSTADIHGSDLRGKPILVSHLELDGSPAGQAAAWQRLGSDPAWQRWAANTAAHSGLTEFNYLYRDVNTSELRKAYLAARITTDPRDARLGELKPGATFEAFPNTSFGKTLRRMRMTPEFAIHLPYGRFVLEEGWAPETEPSR
jgi:hypothetical protein